MVQNKREESIEAWRYFSRRARAVINIAANLKLGELENIEDWRALRSTAAYTGRALQELDEFAPFMLTMLPRTEYPFAKNGSARIGDSLQTFR